MFSKCLSPVFVVFLADIELGQALRTSLSWRNAWFELLVCLCVLVVCECWLVGWFMCVQIEFQLS